MTGSIKLRLKLYNNAVIPNPTTVSAQPHLANDCMWQHSIFQIKLKFCCSALQKLSNFTLNLIWSKINAILTSVGFQVHVCCTFSPPSAVVLKATPSFGVEK